MENIWSYHNILGIIVSFIYVIGVIFLAKFLERFGKEASRKAVHILVCNWWPMGSYKVFGANKTVSGSTTMLTASFLVTLILLAATDQPQILLPAITLAVLATVLEALTPLGLDNLTVPLGSAAAYYFLFV